MAFEWDAVTGQSRRSDNAAQILGADDERANSPLRDGFLECVHPDDIKTFKSQLRELSPSNPSYVLSFRFCCPDGRQVWLEETAQGEFDASGRLSRIKGLTRDITERKKAELALEERNVQLALAGEAGRVGSYAYSIDSDVMQVSAGYAALHGLPEGTTETTRSAWRTRAHPEDLARVEEVRRQAFRKRLTDFEIEYRIFRSERVRWIKFAQLHFLQPGWEPTEGDRCKYRCNRP